MGGSADYRGVECLVGGEYFVVGFLRAHLTLLTIKIYPLPAGRFFGTIKAVVGLKYGARIAERYT